MHDKLKLLDIVVLTEDLPEKSLRRGQVGTIVEELGPDLFEVEFCDTNGRTYAMLALPAGKLLRLHHEPVLAAKQ